MIVSANCARERLTTSIDDGSRLRGVQTSSVDEPMVRATPAAKGRARNKPVATGRADGRWQFGRQRRRRGYTGDGLGSLDSAQAAGRFEPAVVVETGAFGVSSVARANAGDDVGRMAWLRRIDARPPWDAALLSALEASVANAREIHSPAVLGIIDVARSPDALLVATEYVEGVLLESVLVRAFKRRRPVPVEVAVHVARALAGALATAEEALVAAGAPRALTSVHPECVLLGTGDDALLADLGLVALAPDLDDPVALAYRAPEQLAGAAAAGGAGAVYSVGLILWELLAGREAFDQRLPGTSSADVRRRVAAAPLPRLEHVAGRQLPLVAELAMQCLAHEPGARFASARELAAALGTVAGRPRGEVARLVDELASDLVAAQRKAFYADRPPVASERPTLHDVSISELPKVRRPIGLAAFTPVPPPSGPGVDSGQAVDALLDGAPVSNPQPLPLVHAVAPAAPAQEPAPPSAPPGSAPRSLSMSEPQPTSATLPTPSSGELDLPQPGRRWGLVAVVVLVVGGALALAVVAGLRALEKPVPIDVAATVAAAPAAPASVAEQDAASPSASPGSAPAPEPGRVAGAQHGAPARHADEPHSSVKPWDPWDHSADAGAHAAAPPSSAPPAASAAAPCFGGAGEAGGIVGAAGGSRLLSGVGYGAGVPTTSKVCSPSSVTGHTNDARPVAACTSTGAPSHRIWMLVTAAAETLTSFGSPRVASVAR